MNIKKILIVSETPTHPTLSGNRAVILSYSSLLKDLGYDVYLLYSDNEYVSESDYIATRKYWGDHFFYFKKIVIFSFLKKVVRKLFRIMCKNILLVDSKYPWGLSGYVKALQKKHDFYCIIINYVWLSRLFLSSNISKKAIFTHDVFSNRNQKTNSSEDSLTLSQEAKALQRCPYILAVQEKEAVFFSYLAPKSNIFTVFFPIKYTETIAIENKNILFFSSDNKYNIEGINFFISSILPSIVSVFPDVKLIIGGSICNTLQVACPLSKHIEYFGFVNDIYEYYLQGDIFINPVFNGTGLKIKTFEAISFGKVVITHQHSTEGVFNYVDIPVYTAEMAEDYIKWLNIFFTNKRNIIQNKLKCKDYMDKYNYYIIQQYRKLLEE